MKIRINISFIISICFLMLAPDYLMGQYPVVKDSKDPWKRLELNVGGYFSEISSNSQISGENAGVGVVVDFEKALGLQTTSRVFRTELTWALGKKKSNFLQFNYYSINRKSEKVVDIEFEFDGTTYEEGTTIGTSSKFQILNLNYGYSFYKTENFNLGATFGVYVVPLEASIKASGFGDEGAAFIAPLPTLGVYTKFAFTEKLLMIQSINLFYLKYGDYAGSFNDINFRLEYNVTKYVGFGGGINSMNINVSGIGDVTENLTFKGSFGYRIIGGLVYIKLYI